MAWWVALLTLPALAPLARAGFFDSHDGLIHTYRLAGLDRAVRAGVLYPRWFPEFAFGYGQPVLNFYGPLSYYLGLPFTLLGVDASLALKLVLAGGLLASAGSMYRFARLHLAPTSALAAALVYVYLPYHLVDLYVRGALAEFWAFVWFPLALWAFHRLVRDAAPHRLTQVGLAALSLAALILTHSLSAFLFAPVLAAYVLILLLRNRAEPALGRVLASLALALALTAFHWLPILAEARYVGLGHGASHGYRDHLLPWADLVSLHPVYPYPPVSGGAPTFPLGLMQIAIVAAAAVAPLLCPRERRWPTVFFLALALLSTFMLTKASQPVWQLFEPALAFLQYPWRFQALTTLATAFLAGFLFSHVRYQVSGIGYRVSRPLFYVLRFTFYGLLLAWSLWTLPLTPTTPDLSVEATWAWDRQYGQVGVTWTGEYLPIWVEAQRWAISHPAPAPAADTDPLPAGQVRLAGVGHTRYELSLDAAQDTTLVLHQFHYPGWQAKMGGVSQASRPEGALGLAAFDLPAGRGALSLHLGLTPAQRWGSLLSLFAALGLGVTLVARYQLSRLQRPLWLAAGAMLLACVLLGHVALPNGYARAVTPVNANLEDTAELLSFATDRQTYRPGETVAVTLYWRALRRPGQDYKTFVHLTDAALTRQPAQHDGDPGGGYTPTTRWLPGELVPDPHNLVLPADLAPGRYRLWAGMYEHPAVRNLAVLAAETKIAAGRVLLGEIEVLAP